VTAADRSAPGVRLTLFRDEKATVGEPLALGDRLLSFTYEEAENKTDKLSLSLDNFDLSLFEREELMGGAVLEAAWGYPGRMSPPRRAIVKTLKGFQTLTVEGLSLGALLNQAVKTRRWEGKTRAEVVREIAREHGYDDAFLFVDDTPQVLDTINQAAETDARLLTRLAAREGFAFFVDDTGLHWHRRRLDTAPTRVFTWYSDRVGDLLSINVESDLVRRAGGVEVRGRDPAAKTTLTAGATAANAVRPTLGNLLEVIDPRTGLSSLLLRNATYNVAPSSAATAGAAAREAEARFVKAEREAIKLSAQVVGDPELRAKTIVELRGIGTMLSGKYYVNEAKHSISSSGYTVDLKLTRDAKANLPGAVGGGNGVPQTGDRNRSAATKPGARRAVEVIDRVTGASRIEYRDDGAGSGDPEASKGGG
jgi:phage protein D